MSKDTSTLVARLGLVTDTYRCERDELVRDILSSIERRGTAEVAYTLPYPGSSACAITVYATLDDRRYSVRFDGYPIACFISGVPEDGVAQRLVLDITFDGKVTMHDDVLNTTDVLAILASVDDLGDDRIPDLTNLVVALASDMVEAVRHSLSKRGSSSTR